MKRGFPLLLFLLLLTACGGSIQEIPETRPGIPELRPLEKELSAPAVVTEGREPEADYELPAELTWFPRDWTWDQPVALLAECPEAQFYGVRHGDDTAALIRWGDSLAEFDWLIEWRSSPSVCCFDADDDGQDELAVITLWGAGTGICIYQLHILEQDENGILTDYAFPQSLFEDLSKELSVETIARRAFAVLGNELVEFTHLLPEETDFTAFRGLVAGSNVYFEPVLRSDFGGRLRFRGGVWLDSGQDQLPPTVWYVADLDAVVSYENGAYTLSQIHLNSLR